jgi:hypothetical protein
MMRKYHVLKRYVNESVVAENVLFPNSCLKRYNVLLADA